jgi:hypothetical protein
MDAIQSFLIVVLCAFVWLTIILGLALAGEATIAEQIDAQRAGPGWEEL